MKINNCLDLYDYYIVKSFEDRFKRLDVKNLKYLFSPMNLCFYFAKEKFGERILPFFNIWRNEPPVLTTDASSLVNFNTNIVLNENVGINFLLLSFTYNIKFFSNNMFDMNKVVIMYYRMRSSPFIDIDLTDIGLSVKYRAEAKLGEISSENIIDESFEKGRYFSYGFDMTCRLLLIENVKNIKLDKINFNLINDGYLLYNKLVELE